MSHCIKIIVSVSAIQTCAPNQFQCANKKCIPYVWKCDHDNDCGDNSDEPENCKTIPCRPHYLKCNSTGRYKTECEPTYFKCKNSRCIPGRWRCDYDNDCRDNSDEEDCSWRNCTESEFKCQNGRCILQQFKCDGHNQCTDGSDELNCPSYKCNATEFTCSQSRYCIPQTWKCDGDVDCTDESDELNCNYVSETCTSQEFHCRNGQCIPYTWQCDGHHDCLDKSDEDFTACQSHMCLPAMFRCKRNHTCISYEHVCDGVPDCRDHSDELHCVRHLCGPGEFTCLETGQCINAKYVCDNYTNCVDSSDESQQLCSSHVRCSSPANCSGTNQMCTDGRCVCKSGYKLSLTGDTCEGSPPYVLIGMENELHATPVKPNQDFTPLYNGSKDEKDNSLRIDSMAIYMKENLVFITNHHTGTVWQHKVPASLQQTAAGGRHPVDWSGQRLYWADAGSHEIAMCLLDGTQRRTLFNTNLQDVNALVVDPESYQLFWICGGVNPRIEAAFLDGSNRHVLVDQSIQWPSSLAVDFPNRRLYWTDIKKRTIESVTLSGAYRKQVWKFAPG
ncbi:hypothetical protein NP493_13g04008 [Ridgeia piscesae]|uniref:Uncharacterized protein n=1 Tax=Ridgeia piscesae TaxID=27915 RepID=A0AAD9PEY7_RIDPI|nr:hypothetical protein NP493_13g04008 [Ridgeia piscesae]